MVVYIVFKRSCGRSRRKEGSIEVEHVIGGGDDRP